MIMYVLAVMVVAGLWLVFRLGRSAAGNRSRNTRRATRPSAHARRNHAGKVVARGAHSTQLRAERPAAIPPAPEKATVEPWRSHQTPSARPARAAEPTVTLTRLRPPATSTAGIVRALSHLGEGEARVTAESAEVAPHAIAPAAMPEAAAAAVSAEAVSVELAMPPAAAATLASLVDASAGDRAAPVTPFRHDAAPTDDLAQLGPMAQVLPLVPRPVEAPLPVATPAPARVPRPAPPVGAVPATLRTASNDEHVEIAPPATAPTPTAAPKQRRIELPSLELLATPPEQVAEESSESLAATGELIEQRLREFKVPVTVVGASAGPVITRYEVEPAVGVRGSQIVALMKDLARGLGRTSIRVVETIPGKTCMGLELPNERRQMIGLADILRADAYQEHDSPLALAMGKDITGQPVVADLARAPHMLVAGTTGSGKSVAVNAMILSMLYKATPDDVRMIMIDPKMLELSVYEGIPHLLAPVVTDMKLAANALNWCVAEMENRYRLMSELRVRNLAGYNQKIREARAAGTPLSNPLPAHVETPELLDTLPLIVVLIDELADLMMVAGKKIEELIARLAQKARAAGIHLILATQRPSVDVITGLIKANIPTRVAFQVSSKIDSRTILDQMGAESLLGQGDMLFLPPGTGYPQRVHGAFVADDEVHRVVAHLKRFGAPDYREDILAGPPSEAADLFGEEAADAELDPLYDEAVAFVLRSRRASISSVQRQLRIGYNRAARLIESMEAAGLVSAMGHNGSREVLAPGPSEGM